MWESNQNTSVENINRLDLHTRNKIQIELMQIMLPEATEKAEYDWIIEYGEKVSEIIDHNENEEIRRLALDGKIHDSALKLKEKLEQISLN
jgi:hypothetical protein